MSRKNFAEKTTIIAWKLYMSIKLVLRCQTFCFIFFLHSFNTFMLNVHVYTYTYTIKNNYMYSIIPETATI